jgi:hypothetical protein
MSFGSSESPAVTSVRAHLPGYGKLHVLRNAAVRTGVYAGAGMAVVLTAWIIAANRFPALEGLALERNLAGAVALGLFAAVPVLRFLRLPGHLLASSLIAWSILAIVYRLLCIYFWLLAERHSAVQLFTLGAVVYMILATLSWIGTLIWRARESNISHSNHHLS